MVSLVDIVPQTRTVQIAGGELLLRGLGLRQIADLLLRFPTFRDFLQGSPEIDIDSLLIVMPDTVATIVAEAAAQPEAADTIANTMSIDDLAECLLVVRDLTMPNGAAPFLNRLAKLLGRDAEWLGKARDTTSLPQPNGSLLPDTAQAK